MSVASVGGIRKDLQPGTLMLPDQIIDYTHGRESTFAEYGSHQVTHTDFTWPYCEAMRQSCLQALKMAGEDSMEGGVYGCVQGPRLESKAEIDRMASRLLATRLGSTRDAGELESVAFSLS